MPRFHDVAPRELTIHYVDELYQRVTPVSGGNRTHRYLIYAGGRQVAQASFDGIRSVTPVADRSVHG